jgi:hypothetical protein
MSRPKSTDNTQDTHATKLGALDPSSIPPIRDALNWLQTSHEAVGRCGFSIGFDIRRGWLAPYAETTGYIVPTMLRVSKYAGLPDIEEIAIRSAEWLLGIQQPDGSFPDYRGRARAYRERPPVVFNTAQDVFGLTSCFAWTGEERYLEAATRAGQWLAKQMNVKGYWDNPGFGDGPSRSYYSRVTWPMAIIAKCTGNQAMLDVAQKGAAYIAAKARSDGWIAEWDFKPNQAAYTHTMAYTIEGLLEQSEVTDDPDLRRVGVHALEAVANVFSLNQSLAGAYWEGWKGDHSYICGPGHCQFAILFMQYSRLAQNPDTWTTIGNKLLATALSSKLRYRFLPSGLRGAVPASSPMILGRYEQWLVPNWGQKYAIDAVLLRDATSTGRWQSLLDILKKYPG